MELWEKSETVDPEVRAYIYSLVNAVGGQSNLDDRYALGDDALAVLNDLVRWLRLYDEKTNRFDVKRCLAESNLVKGDLLEILALWPEDAQDNKLKAKLAISCIQLLVPLTWPLELEENKTTANHLRHMPFIKLAQVGYKRAILHYEDAQILRTAVRTGLPAMAEQRRERTKRDESIIKLMLYFFRNIVMITQPQDLPSQGDENEISRSSTIEAFHEQDVFSLLLTIGSGAGDEFQEQDVIILETLFHLLKGVDPKRLFMQQDQLATEDTNELRSLVYKEKAMLNDYKRNAPTRHNRFGTLSWLQRDNGKMSTVSGQSFITDSSNTLHQIDSSKKWDKPKYRGKLAQEVSESTDFGGRIDLTESARKHLASFVEDFLDSSFNPLFASLRKAIERETDRVGPIHHRQFYYLISWFLQAEAARRDQTRSKSGLHVDQPTQPTAEDNTFAYIAAVLDQETFVLLNRDMQKALDEKSWKDLQATLLCFTQILLTVQSMFDSKDEEDQEIAENIQNRIFYEESTHDRMVAILRGYSNQGFAYLDAVTDCMHVFVRMLERYSKQNVDLQIRSKRRARKKSKQQSQPDEASNQNADEDTLEAAEDEQEAYSAARERKFDFARFSTKFLTQPCVNTFIALLQFYADLSPAQLKRCHRYLYRLAFKHELTVMLFRADILQLLLRMIKGPQGLDPGMKGFKDWEQLVQQVFRRCIKWMDRESEGEGWKEAAVVEMLFSKIPNTLFYLQNGFERVIEKRAPRPPAELELKHRVDPAERIGVAVSLLLEQGKQDAVEWVKKELQRAVDDRQAWNDRGAALASIEHVADVGEGEEADNATLAPTIFLSHDNAERKEALFRDKYLRLLLTTLKLERLGAAEDVDASWIVPAELTPAVLKTALDQIEKTEVHGTSLAEPADNLVRAKSAARRGAAAFSEEESGSEDGDVDEALFPPNLKEKSNQDDAARPKKKRHLTRRNQTELTDEQIKEREDERKKRERERNSRIKSSLFVTASDDESDAEGDAAFFRKEEETRKRTAGVIRHQLLKEAQKGDAGTDGTKKRKKKGGDEDAAKKRKRTFVDDGEGRDDLDMFDADGKVDSDALDAGFGSEFNLALDISTDTEQGAESSAEDNDTQTRTQDHRDQMDEDDTPSTSPRTLDKHTGDEVPLGEVSGNVRPSRIVDDDEDEDDMPMRKPVTQRRNVRAGFIVESDSE